MYCEVVFIVLLRPRHLQHLAAGLGALVGRPIPTMKSPYTTTTLSDLHRATPWLWLYYEKCPHSAPIACAVPVIRWGPNTSSDKLWRCARCTACGHKGATLQHPGWGGADVGFLPFPAHLLAPVHRGAELPKPPKPKPPPPPRPPRPPAPAPGP
jgi:hypothetical protein